MTIDNLISWLQEAEDNNTWLVSTQSVKRHLEKIKETEQLTIHSVVDEFCPKCKSTDVSEISDHYTKCCDCGFEFVG
jgi:ribosomal protein L37AE/L43A